MIPAVEASGEAANPGSKSSNFGLDSLWASFTAPSSSSRTDGKLTSATSLKLMRLSSSKAVSGAAGAAAREVSRTSRSNSVKLMKLSGPSSSPGDETSVQASLNIKSVLSEGCAQWIKQAVGELEGGTAIQQMEAVAMLSALFALGPAYRQYAHKAGVAVPLLKLLHSSDSQVIALAAKAVVELSRCDVPRAGLRDKGCIPLMVAYLRQGCMMVDTFTQLGPDSSRAICNVVQALGAVARDEQGKGAVKSAGVITIVQQLMQQLPATLAEVMQECLMMLLELCKLPSAKAELCSDKGLLVLLQLLEATPDPATEVVLLRLLVQLVSFPQAKAAVLGSSTIMKRLIDMLGYGVRKEVTQLSLQLLATLAADSEAIPVLRQTRAIKPIVDLTHAAHDAPASLQQWLVHALSSLAQHSLACEEVASAGAATALLQLLAKTGPTAPGAGLISHALLVLVEGSRNARMSLLHSDGVQQVLQLLYTGACPQDVGSHLLMVLAELVHDPRVKAQLCAPAAVQSLVTTTLQASDEKCVTAAVGLLSELSTVPAAAAELLQLHGLHLFVQLLVAQGMYSLDSPVSLACFKGIAGLTAACKDLQLLSSSGAMYLLVEAIKASRKAAVLQPALQALCCICKHLEAAEALVASEVLTEVVGLMTGTDEVGADTSATCTRLLSVVAGHSNLVKQLATEPIATALKQKLEAAVAAFANDDTLQLLELLTSLCSTDEGAAAAAASGLVPVLLQLLPQGRGLGSLAANMAAKVLLMLLQAGGGVQACLDAGAVQQLCDALQGYTFSSFKRSVVESLLLLLRASPDNTPVPSQDTLMGVGRMLHHTRDAQGQQQLSELLQLLGEQPKQLLARLAAAGQLDVLGSNYGTPRGTPRAGAHPSRPFTDTAKLYRGHGIAHLADNHGSIPRSSGSASGTGTSSNSNDTRDKGSSNSNASTTSTVNSHANSGSSSSSTQLQVLQTKFTAVAALSNSSTRSSCSCGTSGSSSTSTQPAVQTTSAAGAPHATTTWQVPEQPQDKPKDTVHTAGVVSSSEASAAAAPAATPGQHVQAATAGAGEGEAVVECSALSPSASAASAGLRPVQTKPSPAAALQRTEQVDVSSSCLFSAAPLPVHKPHEHLDHSGEHPGHQQQWEHWEQHQDGSGDPTSALHLASQQHDAQAAHSLFQQQMQMQLQPAVPAMLPYTHPQPTHGCEPAGGRSTTSSPAVDPHPTAAALQTPADAREAATRVAKAAAAQPNMQLATLPIPAAAPQPTLADVMHASVAAAVPDSEPLPLLLRPLNSQQQWGGSGNLHPPGRIDPANVEPLTVTSQQQQQQQQQLNGPQDLHQLEFVRQQLLQRLTSAQHKQPVTTTTSPATPAPAADAFSGVLPAPAAAAASALPAAAAGAGPMTIEQLQLLKVQLQQKLQQQLSGRS